jgi:guanylate cyclase soluble subunit beta
MIIYSFSLVCAHTVYFNKEIGANGDLKLKCAHKSSMQEADKTADHIQFLITEVGPKTPKTCSDDATNDIEKENFVENFELVSGNSLVSPQIFCQVFPFHLMFDRQMCIVQAGKSVSRVIPKVAEQDCNLLDILEPIRPHIQLSFQTILSHISTIYVLKTKPETMLESDTVMRLKVNY